MRVISYRRIRDVVQIHADSQDALDNWFKVANKAEWRNLLDVQSNFSSAEAVGNFTVFIAKDRGMRTEDGG
jgi:mRNA interferase HigB